MAPTIWVASSFSNEINRIDVAARQLREPIHVGVAPRRLARAEEMVWVFDPDTGSIASVEGDPDSGRRQENRVWQVSRATAIAPADDGLWVAVSRGRRSEVRKLDAAGNVVRGVRVPPAPAILHETESYLWVVHDSRRGRLSRVLVRPAIGDGDLVGSRELTAGSPEVRTITTGPMPRGILVHGGYVWVSSWADTGSPVQMRSMANLGGLLGAPPTSGHGRLDRIGVDDLESTHVDVGLGAVGMCHTDGTVWLAHTGDKGLLSIDAATGMLTGHVRMTLATFDVRFVEGKLWCAHALDDVVSVIDPETLEVEDLIDCPGPLALLVNGYPDH